VKKIAKSKVATKKGMAVMVEGSGKNFDNYNLVVEEKAAQIQMPLAYHCSHFLATTLDFTYFHNSFLWGAHFF